MAGIGSGRYTTYVPVSSPQRAKLWNLYNGKSASGDIYGGSDVGLADAAKNVVTNGAKYLSEGLGDRDLFGSGVDMSFGAAPNIKEDVKFKAAGDPANPYVPDLRSPGSAGDGIVNVDPKSKEGDPGLSVADVKPNMVIGERMSGTANPSATRQTSNVLSRALEGKIQPGKSSV